MINDSFTIKPYHWWLTMSVAMVLHVSLLINYKQENVHIHEHANSDRTEVIIGLKKLKPSPVTEKSNVIETTPIIPAHVEPVKPKPIIKKQKILKPKPIEKSKPAAVKSAVTSPQIAPLNTERKPNNTSSRQSEKNTTNLNINSTYVITENEKTLYYAKLAQWLERHKKYPTIARRRNQQGNVTIQFVMNREGELLRYQLTKPSEHHSLNTATIKMLERASPMPVPPKQLIGDKAELEYAIPVKFNLVK